MGVIKKMDGLFLLDRVKFDKKYNQGREVVLGLAS
jgi:hypothetical protein